MGVVRLVETAAVTEDVVLAHVVAHDLVGNAWKVSHFVAHVVGRRAVLGDFDHAP